MTKNIVVIGMGYVGIPCGALLADVPGFRVTGVQRRSERSGWKIEWLNAGKCPFEADEPGLAELIHRVAVEKGTFRVTDDYAVCREADVIVIDVQTPVDEDHVPRYESLRQASEQVGRYLQAGTLVIIESTVAPGTTRNVLLPILEHASGLKTGADFYLAFSYERVMPGKLLEYITDFPRVVGAIDPESTRRAVELYRHIVRKEITPTDVLMAEVAKTVENAYRDVNIAFANEVALICESLGVNVYEVRELINARPDRHMHLPGAGVGGHCLPKDSWLLKYGADRYGRKQVDKGQRTGDKGRGKEGRLGRTEGTQGASGLEMIQLARGINDGMPGHMVELIEEALREAGLKLAGSKVAVLGVAYLENSDDARNTPAVPLTHGLLSRGAKVVAHDPYVRERDWAEAQGLRRDFQDGGVPLVQDLEAALQGADCAVVVTKHREYFELDLAWAKELMRTPAIVDGRNVFDAHACARAGLIYRGIGKGWR